MAAWRIQSACSEPELSGCVPSPGTWASSEKGAKERGLLSQYRRHCTPASSFLLQLACAGISRVWALPSSPLVKIPLSQTAVCQGKTWILCHNKRIWCVFSWVALGKNHFISLSSFIIQRLNFLPKKKDVYFRARKVWRWSKSLQNRVKFIIT